jgi:hypothetical protein
MSARAGIVDVVPGGCPRRDLSAFIDARIL